MTKIKLDARNYRRHNDKNLELIEKSLKECGAGRSILIDNENTVIAGNGCLSQAEKLNIPVKIIETDGSELIAIKRTDLNTDDEKRKQLAIMDNSTSDSSDFDLTLLQEDFDISDLSDWGIDGVFDLNDCGVEQNFDDIVEKQKQEKICPHCGGIFVIEHKIIIATNEMINYACKNFHYSKSVPCGRKIAYAIFEEKRFIGVIIYSLGANNNMAKSFNLLQGECIELTRIALNSHKNNVSRYIALTLKMIKKQCKTVKLIVSYADKENQNHNGAIYQASNWIYLGISKCSDKQYFYKGHWTHLKLFQDMKHTKGKDYVEKLIKNLPQRKNSDKHKYIYCFDSELKNKYDKIKKEYPKKNNAVVNSESENQLINGGASPTLPLQH